MHGKPIISMDDIREIVEIIAPVYIAKKIHIVNQQMSAVMMDVGERIYGVELMENSVGTDITLVGQGAAALSYTETIWEFFNLITVGGLSPDATAYVNNAFIKGINEQSLITDRYLVISTLSVLMTKEPMRLSRHQAARLNELIVKNFHSTPYCIAKPLNQFRSDTMRLSNRINDGYFARNTSALADRMYGNTEPSVEHDELVEDGVQLQLLLQEMPAKDKELVWAIMSDMMNKVAKRYTQEPIPQDLPFIDGDSSDNSDCKCKGCKCCSCDKTQQGSDNDTDDSTADPAG